MVKILHSVQAVIILGALALLVLPLVFALTPDGASGTYVRSSTTNTTHAPSSNGALAGNVTEIGINGQTATQSWQGYFGNVTGTIHLTDSSNNVFYNWTVSIPEGEVLASINSSIAWTNIQCFNFTALGTYNSPAGETPGATNLNGTNMSILEADYNITWDDVDGVNETFLLKGAATHDQFFIASRQFDIGECQNTRIYSNAGLGENDKFEEAILYEPTSSSVIFATLIDNDVLGFDTKAHDFEMLVLENGHGTDVSTTTYYFFVELN
jgi:hypothetical protein